VASREDEAGKKEMTQTGAKAEGSFLNVLPFTNMMTVSSSMALGDWRKRPHPCIPEVFVCI
jgi:hypothetical protein